MAENLEVKVRFGIEGDKVVVNGIDNINQKVEQTGATAEKSGGAFAKFFKVATPVAATLAIIKFFKDSINAAEEENEALRKLKFEIEAQGLAWSDVGQKITQFADTMQVLTRFSDTETYEVVGKLTRQLGNLDQAFTATQLAADIASATGKDFAEVSDLLGTALTRPERGAMTLRREFGAIVGSGKDVEVMMQNLQKHFEGAAEKEDSLTKTTKQLGNSFGDFMESVGRGITPVWNAILVGADAVIKVFLTLANSMSKVIAFFAPGSWKEKMDRINQLTKEGADIWVKSDNRKIDSTKKVLKTVKGSNEEQLEAEKKLAEDRKKVLEQFNNDYIKTTKGTYALERAEEEKRYKAVKDAINKEIKDKKQRNVEIAKNDEVHRIILEAIAKKEVADKEAIAEKFNLEYLEMMEGRFEREKREIDKEAEIYIEAGIDKNKVDQWQANEYTRIENEKRKIEKEETDKEINEQIKSRELLNSKLKEIDDELLENRKKTLKASLELVDKEAEYKLKEAEKEGLSAEQLAEYKVKLEEWVQSRKKQIISETTLDQINSGIGIADALISLNKEIVNSEVAGSVDRLEATKRLIAAETALAVAKLWTAELAKSGTAGIITATIGTATLLVAMSNQMAELDRQIKEAKTSQSQLGETTTTQLETRQPGTYGEPPELQGGGKIEKTGLAIVHKGEQVIPEGKRATNITNNFNISLLDLSQLDQIRLKEFVRKISLMQKQDNLVGGL